MSFQNFTRNYQSYLLLESSKIYTKISIQPKKKLFPTLEKKPTMRIFNETHKKFVEKLIERIKEYYGDNLVSVVIFGSYARGDNKTNSDIDILIVLEKAGKSRRERLNEFIENIELPLSDLYEILLEDGIYVDVTPVILTKEEASFFNPLYLSIIQNKIIIYDRDNFIQSILEKVKELLRKWGCKKENVGSHEVWVIRKGKPIEVVKLG